MAQHLWMSGLPRRRNALRSGDSTVIRAIFIEIGPLYQLGVDAGVVKSAVAREGRMKVRTLLLERMEMRQFLLERLAYRLGALRAETPSSVAVARSWRRAQERGNVVVIVSRHRLTLRCASYPQALAGRRWARLAHPQGSWLL